MNLAEDAGKTEAAAFLRERMAEHPDEEMHEAVTERGPVHLMLATMIERDM